MDLQTFVLRVTIHCHGCKKKDVKVDAQLHKVMVTGTVDAETLIKRLHKSGKQALPWQHTPAKNPDPAPPAPADAPAPAEDGSKDAAVAEKKPAELVKEPQADSSDKKPEQETAPEKKPEAEKEAESEKKADKEEEAKPSDEAKQDGGEGEPKAKGAEPASEPAAAAKEAGGNDEAEAKKKQSKPKDADRSLSPAPAHAPMHARHEFNPYGAPQPVMSYNMAQPRASVSHYAPRPEQGYSLQQQQAGIFGDAHSMKGDVSVYDERRLELFEKIQAWHEARIKTGLPLDSLESGKEEAEAEVEAKQDAAPEEDEDNDAGEAYPAPSAASFAMAEYEVAQAEDATEQ
ncbi:unnamed protein product [Triticum turgidum subsp. durum]|uniref:HMA domain-containing protein n=1 Tax=Triticum turgidum subsp. durum TaxID=4567 RepID=A0A9R0TK72_TRITD|nr:unnamed protein product [Triticum turgidum subsp. durum]